MKEYVKMQARLEYLKMYREYYAETENKQLQEYLEYINPQRECEKENIINFFKKDFSSNLKQIDNEIKELNIKLKGENYENKNNI